MVPIGNARCTQALKREKAYKDGPHILGPIPRSSCGVIASHRSINYFVEYCIE